MPSLRQTHLAKILNVCETLFFKVTKVKNIVAVPYYISSLVHKQNMSAVTSQKQMYRTIFPGTALRPYVHQTLLYKHYTLLHQTDQQTYHWILMCKKWGCLPLAVIMCCNHSDLFNPYDRSNHTNILLYIPIQFPLACKKLAHAISIFI